MGLGMVLAITSIIIGLIGVVLLFTIAVMTYRRGQKLQAVIFGATAACFALTAIFSAGTAYYTHKADEANQKTQRIIRELENG